MKKIASILASFALVFSTAFAPTVMAADDEKDDGGVEAAILTGCANEEDGVGCILKLVVDIMSVGIGILGLIGITIVGVQYLTSSGDEGKARKAKQRMFEIIIGLAAYVVIYAVLRWLLPGLASQ